MAEGRTALLVGAGPEQVPSLEAARTRGLRVVALDGNPSAPGLAASDVGLVVDISDEQAVVEVARRHHAEVVVPAPLGRLLTTVGAVNEALGLPGIRREHARRCVEKVAFDEVLEACGLPRPRTLVAGDEDEVLAAVAQLGQRCVLKPSEGAGSVGVLVVDEGTDPAAAVREHLSSRGPGQRTLVCERVDGTEVGIDALVTDGAVEVVAVRAKVLTPPPHRVATGLVHPSGVDAGPIQGIVERIAVELGLTTCAMHLDAIVGERDVHVIEAAPRPAGMFISTGMLPSCCGRDLVDDVLAALLGEPPAAPREPSPATVMRVVPWPTGTRPGDPEELLGMGATVFGPTPGRGPLGPIRSVRDVLDRGLMLVTGADPESAWARSDAILTAAGIPVGP